MIMFILRSNLSATAPASGPSNRAGSSEVSQTPLTAYVPPLFPPMSLARNESASRASQSPRLDSVSATHSRLNGVIVSTLGLRTAKGDRKFTALGYRPCLRLAADSVNLRRPRQENRNGTDYLQRAAVWRAAQLGALWPPDSAGELPPSPTAQRTPGGAGQLPSARALFVPRLPVELPPAFPVFAELAAERVPARRFGAGPDARRSASSSMARCGVIDSTVSPLRSEAFASPSVTYGPNRPSRSTIGLPLAESGPSSRSGGAAAARAARPRGFGCASSSFASSSVTVNIRSSDSSDRLSAPFFT